MQATNMHFIQKHILRVICYTDTARFKDMKPKNVDSNLYNYHLKLLIKDKIIVKVEGGYKLAPLGMRLVDHISIKNFEPRWQPKVLTKIVAINDSNEILMWPKHKQPFIGRWSLPSGKMHYDDDSLDHAIRREIKYMTEEPPIDLKHLGVIEFQASVSGVVVSHTIAHIFTAKLLSVNHGFTKLVSLSKINELNMSPGTIETINAAENYKGFFYLKYDFSE